MGRRMRALLFFALLGAAQTAAGISQTNTGAFVRDNSVTRARVLGGANSELYYDAIENPDGSIVAIGKTKTWALGDYDILITKFDANLNEVWSVTYGTANADLVYGFRRMADGGYVFATMINTASQICHMVKISGTGTVLWAKKPAITNDGTWCMRSSNAQDSDDVYIGGHKWFWTGSIWTGHGTLMKLTSAGAVVWKKYVDAYANGSGEIINPFGAADGSVYTITFEDNLSGPHAITMSKWNGATGAILWSRSVTGTNPDLHPRLQTADGNIIFYGSVTSAGPIGGRDLLMMKVDPSGNLIWSKAYGTTADESGDANAITLDGDGNLLVAGGLSIASVTRPLLMKVNQADGSLMWSYQYPNMANYELLSLKRLGNGNLLGAGLTSLHGAGGIDGFLVQMNSRGQMTKACSKFQKPATLTVVNSGHGLTPVSLSSVTIAEGLTDLGTATTDRTSVTATAPVCNP